MGVHIIVSNRLSQNQKKKASKIEKGKIVYNYLDTNNLDVKE